MASAGDSSDGTVAVWGTFDLDSFGAQLYPRLTEDEIVRRLPGWTVRTYAPFGWERPCRTDGGFVAEPLGSRDDNRLRRLADAADITLVTGGDLIRADFTAEYGADADPGEWFVSGLGPVLEREHPVLWNAVGVPVEPSKELAEKIAKAAKGRRYVSVRDEVSAQRLRDCGVRGDIAVVPDLGVLVHRLIRSESLRPRVDYFRLMDFYPTDRPALIVQGDSSLVPLVKDVATVLRWALAEVVIADIVILEAGPGDGEFADLLAAQLDPKRTYRLPAGLPPEDVLAAIHGSIGTIASDYHVTLSSGMLGRRWALLDPSSAHESLATLLDDPEHHATSVDGLAEAVRVAFGKQPDPHRFEPLRAKVDEHFDLIAEEADRAWLAGGGSAEQRWADVRRENIQLRAAYRAARKLLAEERRKLLDHVKSSGGGFSAVPQEEIAKLVADSAELERLQNTKLVRWSTPARKFYGKLK